MDIKYVFILALICFLNISSKKSSAKNYVPELSVDDFLSEPDVRDAELSPNGRYLAMVLNKEQMRYLLIQDLEQKGHPIITNIADKVARPHWVKWANNERLIVGLRVPYNVSDVKKRINDNDFDIYDYPKMQKIISMDFRGKEHHIIFFIT